MIWVAIEKRSARRFLLIRSDLRRHPFHDQGDQDRVFRKSHERDGIGITSMTERMGNDAVGQDVPEAWCPGFVAGYLGGSDEFDKAIASWATSYADQVMRDFDALGAAVKSGRLAVETGV